MYWNRDDSGLLVKSAFRTHLPATFVDISICADRSSGGRLFAGGLSCRLRYNNERTTFMKLDRQKCLMGCVILALLTLIGCSNKVPLTGKVTFADTGDPLPNGTVCFAAPGFLARGYLKEDGTYQVSSTGRNDGLPPGKYKVYLVGAELVTSDGNGNSFYTPLIDARYDSADTTDLEFEVDGKVHRFDFKVDRVGK